MNEVPDPLDELLRPVPAPLPTALRQGLRDETSRLVRRRQLTRRVAVVAGLAACLLLAAFVVFRTPSRPEPVPQTPLIVHVQPQTDGTAQEDMNPVALEWQAFDSQTNRAANYFLAGNKYFEANLDAESALRCYTQALDACSDAELEIAPGDNWLVVTLKNARRKERSHE